MKLYQHLSKENGYLLLESLVSLVVISGMLIIISPIIIDWLILQEVKADEVEVARVLYEESVDWPKPSIVKNDYEIIKTTEQLAVSSQNQSIGIEIYETQFK